MSAVKRYNIVTFTPEDGQQVALRLDGAFKWSAGLKPNVNAAIVSYKEFKKLQFADAPPRGDIGFWYTRKPADDTDDEDEGNDGGGGGGGGGPDFTLKDWSIIHVEIAAAGVAYGEGDAPIITEYRLHLSDPRDRFAEPQGGRLAIGVINPSAQEKQAGDTTDAGDYDLTGDDEPYLNSDLIQLCLAAMGVAGVDVPGGVDDISPPSDLRWLGSHAPAELQKLLDRCGCAWVPQADGTFKIKSIGDGQQPIIPPAQLGPQLSLKGLDYRGKIAVVSSAPNQVVRVLNDAGGTANWSFVMQDPSKGWVPMAQAATFKAGGITAADVQNGFSGVAPEHRAIADRDAFCLIQLDNTKFDPAVQPLLRKVWSNDGTVGDIILKAAAATQSVQLGTWLPSSTAVRIPIIEIYPDVGVIRTGIRLGKLGAGVTSALDPDKTFVALNLGADIDITYAVGDATVVGSDNVPIFYEQGFQRSGGSLTKLSADATANAISQRGTVYFSAPELLQINIGTAPQNKTQLDTQAQAIAEGLLRDSDTPVQTTIAAGFVPAVLDGLVTDVEWSQDAVATTFKINHWFSAGGSQPGLRERQQAAKGESHPGEVTTAGKRTSIGGAGSTQPVVPIGPQPQRRFGLPAGSTLYTTCQVTSASAGSVTYGYDSTRFVNVTVTP